MQITREETSRHPEQAVQQYLTFIIRGEEYAINLLKVREIIEYDTVTEVPKTPEWVRGVINLRGNVVPVIDLAPKFRLAPSVAGKLTCIVITEVQCEGEPTVMGIMADSVRQVIDLKPEDIEETPTFGTRVKIDYLLGMARSGKKFCLILDTERVLSTDELLELPTALEEVVENSQGEAASLDAPVAGVAGALVSEEDTENESAAAQAE
jgi:purine-binding chemotaxis protein CheW